MPIAPDQRVRYIAAYLIYLATAKPLNASPAATLGWFLCATLGLVLWQISIGLGVLGVAVGVAVTCLTLNEALSRPRPSRGLRRAAATAIALTLLLNVGFDRCPHATYVSFGPAIYTLSGKACGNPRHPVALLNLLTGIENPWM